MLDLGEPQTSVIDGMFQYKSTENMCYLGKVICEPLHVDAAVRSSKFNLTTRLK